MALQIQVHYAPDEAITPRKRAKLILAHVALVAFSIIYIAMGAGIFHVIEWPNEMEQKRQSLQEIAKFKNDFSTKMWALSRKPTVDSRRWSKAVHAELDSFLETVHAAFSDRRLAMSEIRANSTGHTAEWSFPGSLLFAVSTLGTIGYGHPVPKTTIGRVLCVIFALFGLPLIWFMIVDLAVLLSFGLLKGYPYCARFFRFLRQKYADTIRRAKRSGNADENEAIAESEPLAQPESSSKNRGPEDTGAASVPPIPFLLLILFIYLVLGAALIPAWERGNEWSFFSAFYYCFITVTTIGYGDMAPRNQKFVLATIVYIMLGLILVTTVIMLSVYRCIRNSRFYRPAAESALENVVGS